MGQVAQGRGARFTERGEGFEPETPADHAILREALHDVAAAFGVPTVEALDAALVRISADLGDGELIPLAVINPPSEP